MYDNSSPQIIQQLLEWCSLNGVLFWLIKANTTEFAFIRDDGSVGYKAIKEVIL